MGNFEFCGKIIIFMGDMEHKLNDTKRKRLKSVRVLLPLNALLILVSMHQFSSATHSGWCVRMIVLIVAFGILFVTERNLSRYLREHRDD